jgi:glycosyltransferase involved in cell wall biosynthesis
MNSIVENPQNIDSAEIIVGIPSYKEADNIAFPTDVASRGLLEFFSDCKSVIINVDNNSPDGTKDAFLSTPTKVPKIYISTPEGTLGKGNNLHNLFKATVELDAKFVVMVDADLKSITPNWIRYLGEPLMGRFDLVTPIYVRHKYDGTITNHIAYPLLRSLFGLRVRQPIGGDFGFSGKLARAYLSEKLWNDKVANFGIDIWMTTIAIARGFNVCQAFLGAPKIHRAKDPAADLSMMFTQVVSTLFDLMIDFEYLWKDLEESRPSSIFGFGLGVDEKPPPVDVSTDVLLNSFRSGFEKFGSVWKEILPLPEWSEVEKLAQLDDESRLYYPSDLWARMLFNFAVAYKNDLMDRAQIMDALIPFYHSRVLSFVNKTSAFGTLETEEYLENIIRIFEKQKYYLIQRWNETKNSHNGLLFG